MIETIQKLICKFFHTETFWNGGPTYTCKTCFRTFNVPWKDNSFNYGKER